MATDESSARAAAAERSELEQLWGAVPRPVFSGGNAVRLLRGGDELFPALVEAIDAARHEVCLATYIFHDDAAADRVTVALIQAAQRGVQVKVVLDGFGMLGRLVDLQRRLCEASVQVAVYRPIDRWWNWLQPGQLRRLHLKLCVVDAEIGFVGGINLMDDRFDLNHGWTDEPRLDFAVRVSGPVTGPIHQATIAAWTRAHLGSDFKEEALAIVRGAEPLARLRRLIKRLRLSRRHGMQATPGLMNPMQAAFVLRDNVRQRRTIERSYIDAIRNARTRVDLVSPYFYPGRSFRRALRDAARRGVAVRLLLQGKLDYRIAGLAARALYDELLGQGVRIFEYTPAYLHAKVAVVDADWATVGSSNIDPLSLLLNLEANVIVRDNAFNSELSAHFDAALAVSYEIDPAQKYRPGVLGALRRAIVAWVAYVYLRVAGATGRY
ncbi:MAG: cardiolipin synthase ClsB [Pseudomonadota bacterium]|nr:cardiolipin synthase ClsB [Pseudomonadota bacterium]